VLSAYSGPMSGKRSYDDPCGLARALDLIGERWAMLVVRELLHGPKRFTDLRRGLPTASQNVLSQRLRELEEAGIVHRRRLGPPVSTSVYELTARGQDLEPVLFHLARWGSRAPLTSTAPLSVDALVLALKTTFDPAAAGDLAARYELRLDEDRFRITVAGGRLDVARGGADLPDAVVETNAGTFRSLVFGGRSLADATRAGDVNVRGDRQAVARLVRLFPRPTPAVRDQAGGRSP
jgi:DNA-binding HxlR family transcriptional regulator